jgi:hypothetical protein
MSIFYDKQFLRKIMFDLIVLEVDVKNSGARKGQVAGCSEYNNEPLVLQKGGIFLSDF